MKKLIIHMNNGNQYELNDNKSFDIRSGPSIIEMSGYLTREMNDNERTFTINDEYTDIKYVSRFAIYNVSRVTIALDSISSFELIEVK
mgnify:CR=1 FL=1